MATAAGDPAMYVRDKIVANSGSGKSLVKPFSLRLDTPQEVKLASAGSVIPARGQYSPGRSSPTSRAPRIPHHGKRAAALNVFSSMRTFLIIASVLEVGGAVALSWAITWIFGVRNVETVARQLIDVSHEHMSEVVESSLEEASRMTISLKNAFSEGLLSRARWRQSLARFYASLSSEGSEAAGAPVAPNAVFQHYVYFLADSTAFGILRQGEAYNAFFANATHASSFAVDAQGQPAKLLFSGPLGTDISASSADEASAIRLALTRGISWTDVHLRPASGAPGPIMDRMVVSFKARLVARPGPSGPEPASLGPVPFTLESAPPAPANVNGTLGGPKAGTLVGFVASAMTVSNMNQMLLAHLPTPDSVAFLATGTGAMVASSGDVDDVVDGAAQSVRRADACPNPLIRAVYAELGRSAGVNGSVAAGGTRSVDVGGRTYFVSSTALERAPNLRWAMFTAVPRDAILAEISRSTAVNAAVNSAWLVVSVLLAVWIGIRITRPLLLLRKTMVGLAQTMASVADEFQEGANAAGANERGRPGPGPSPAGLDAPPSSGSSGDLEDGAPCPRESRAAGRPPPAGCCPWFSIRLFRRRGPAPAPTPEFELEQGKRTPEWERQALALRTGISELAAFEGVVRAMRSGFTAFREVSSTELTLMRSLLAERKTKLEMEVRADQTRKFISTMSHEMRTPLNGILGMLQLARDCELPRDVADFVEAASVSAEHLLSIVNDVLDLQKIEAGLIELQSAPTVVADLVAAAERIVQPKAREKGLRLASSIAPDVPPVVVADPDRTRQCLLNFLSNAVKYTSEGSVTVRVELEAAPGDSRRPSGLSASEFERGERGAGAGGAGPLLRFVVEDTGPGISAEQQKQLFTRFYRVRREAGWVDPGGTGLGLAISKEIITRMGGTVSCSSAPGRGSVFSFAIPCTPAKEHGVLAPAVPDGAGRGFGALGGGPASPRRRRAGRCGGGGGGGGRLRGPPASILIAPAPARLPAPEAGDAAGAGASLGPIVLAHRLLLLGAEGEYEGASSRGSAASPRDHVLSHPASGSLRDMAEAPAGPAPLRILVVEDHPLNCRVLRTMLEREGHTVSEAHDGQEARRPARPAPPAPPRPAPTRPPRTAPPRPPRPALRLTSSAQAVALFEGLGAEGAAGGAPFFDVVFMDVQMPVKDGFEATRELRAMERARGWPRHVVIATTGHASAEDEEACLRAGMDKWLTKPIRKPVLLAAIEGRDRPMSGRAAALRRSLHLLGLSPEAPAPTQAEGGPAGARRGGLCSAAGRRRPAAARSLSDMGAAPRPPRPAPGLTPGGRARRRRSRARGPGRHRGAAGRRGGRGSASGSNTPAVSMRRGGGPASHASLLAEMEERWACGASEGSSARGAGAGAGTRTPPCGELVEGQEALVVDDHEMNRRVLEALLTRERMRVHVARDGAEAVAAFQSRARPRPGPEPASPAPAPFAVIFMDVSMPNLDGLDATRRIRELEGALGLPPVPIVACTALSSSADRASALAAGMTEYLVKPVSRPAVHAVLLKWAARAAPLTCASALPSPSLPSPSDGPPLSPSARFMH
eukprot:tig00000093_g3661.t1